MIELTNRLPAGALPIPPQPRPRQSLGRPVPAPRRRLTQSAASNGQPDHGATGCSDYIHNRQLSPIDSSSSISITAINRGMAAENAHSSLAHVAYEAEEKEEDDQRHTSNCTTTKLAAIDPNSSPELFIHIPPQLDLPATPATMRRHSSDRESDDYIIPHNSPLPSSFSPSAPPNSPLYSHHSFENSDLVEEEEREPSPSPEYLPVRFRSAVPDRPQLEPHLMNSQFFPQCRDF